MTDEKKSGDLMISTKVFPAFAGSDRKRSHGSGTVAGHGDKPWQTQPL